MSTSTKFLLALALGGALPSAGCVMPSGEFVSYAADSPELAHASVSPEGVWESVPWSGQDTPWLPFPPRVTVELEHTLGREPRVVLVYLAFDAGATDPALAAGDLARIVEVTNTTITVHNDTNGSYFFRVVAY